MIGLKSLLSISFRPFFLLASLIAVFNPILWVLAYQGNVTLPLYASDPLFWHSHEMLFGFSGALIAGFILTASANWTGSKPYQGKYLVFLITLWVIERCAYFLVVPKYYTLILMNLFYPVLLIMLLLKLWNFPRQKYVFIPILLGFALASFIHSWGYYYGSESFEISGKEMAIGLIRFIVLLIAGRVIPFFTRSRIKNVSIEVPMAVNLLSLVPTFLLIVPWPQDMPKVLMVTILSIAFIANITRQYYWKPFVTVSVPILFILNIGIFFISLEFLFQIIGFFNDVVHSTNAALHLLLAAGLGVIAIGIMSRVSLGHTGRIIHADNWIKLSYLFIVLGSCFRVFIPIFLPDHYGHGLHLAVCLWSGGFAIYFIRFFNILTTPRPDRA